MTQYVYRFGGGVSDGDAATRGNKNLLGGKGANLDGMASIGLPGTSGFIGEFLVLMGIFQVNTVIAALEPTIAKSTLAPIERPIQSRCIVSVPKPPAATVPAARSCSARCTLRCSSCTRPAASRRRCVAFRRCFRSTWIP